MTDFVNDLKVTFPEYESFINKWWSKEDDKTKSVTFLFEFCQKKFPPRFFDILYQNADMFKEESDIDTEFLPQIHFKNLWQYDISQKTRETIWKYLQLIMFSIVGTLENKDAFGDTAKLFEAINQDDFKSKLEETLSQMQGLFDSSGNETENLGSGINMENMPNAEKIQEHITGMLDGKLGQLAREIAEETAANLNMDFGEATDMKDVFQNLVKNPTKLMGLVKTVGDKLDSRIKSGDLKESELMAEATDIMNKMKNMPGMDNIQSMLSKMGLSGALGGAFGGGGKVNMAAMEANLNQKMKLAKTKERIRAKAEANAKAKLEQTQQAPVTNAAPQKPALTDEELIKIFNSGDKAERTPRGAKPNSQENNNKKKKGKK